MTAAPASVEQVHADRAHLIVVGTMPEVFARPAAEVEAGKVLIHPFDDPAVVAAQGTLALELYEDAPEVTDVMTRSLHAGEPVTMRGGRRAGRHRRLAPASRPDRSH